jgi:hypothetical protein
MSAKLLNSFRGPKFYLSGPQWIEPKNVVDVREDQLLVLLLM